MDTFLSVGYFIVRATYKDIKSARKSRILLMICSLKYPIVGAGLDGVMFCLLAVAAHLVPFKIFNQRQKWH